LLDIPQADLSNSNVIDRIVYDLEILETGAPDLPCWATPAIVGGSIATVFVIAVICVVTALRSKKPAASYSRQL